MTRIVKHHQVDQAGLDRLLEPLDHVVLERSSGPLGFELEAGPMDQWSRQLEVAELPNEGTDQFSVTETFEYRLAIPIWKVLFAPLMWHHLRTRATEKPRWAPPDRFSSRASRVISYMAILAIVSGFLGSLLSQTLTFAGAEFDADESRQAFAAGLVRLGTPLAFIVAWLADRQGRRRLLLISATAACVLATGTALAPSLGAYVTIQALSRGLTTAMSLLIGIVAVEESPSGSRAFVVSVVALAAGLGSGMVVWALPLAGTSDAGWRWIFVIAVIGLVPIAVMWRGLPETTRFAAASSTPSGAAAPAGPSPTARRLMLLGATAFLFTLFAAPASTLNNNYLETVHDFDPSTIRNFKLITSTPIGLGVLVAGWIADRKGRKKVGAFGILAGVIFTALEYNTAGLSLWVFGIIGTILGGAVVPTLGVYGPELFGTMRRGKTNGLITMIGVLGSVSGLFLASWLLQEDGWDLGYGRTFAILAIGPVIVAGLVLFLFPETANRTLEDINPEDAAQLPGRVAQPGN